MFGTCQVPRQNCRELLAPCSTCPGVPRNGKGTRASGLQPQGAGAVRGAALLPRPEARGHLPCRRARLSSRLLPGRSLSPGPGLSCLLLPASISARALGQRRPALCLTAGCSCLLWSLACPGIHRSLLPRWHWGGEVKESAGLGPLSLIAAVGLGFAFLFFSWALFNHSRDAAGSEHNGLQGRAAACPPA